MCVATYATAERSRRNTEVTADNCGDQKGEISDSSRNREISPRAQISPGRDSPFEGGIWMAPKYHARQIPPFWSLQLSAVNGPRPWWLVGGGVWVGRESLDPDRPLIESASSSPNESTMTPLSPRMSLVGDSGRQWELTATCILQGWNTSRRH